MFDDLSAEDPTQRSILERAEKFDRIRLLDRQALAPRVRHHVGVRVDALHLDTRFAQEADELAATATDVEHRCLPAELVDVPTLPFSYLAHASAQATLEREVVRKGRGALLRRNGDGDGLSTATRPALHTCQPLLQLAC